MRVTVEIEVEQLPGDRLLAFYQHIATAKSEDGEPTFEVSRSLTGMQFSAAQKVGDQTITHTFNIQPVIETVLAAIQEGQR